MDCRRRARAADAEVIMENVVILPAQTQTGQAPATLTPASKGTMAFVRHQLAVLQRLFERPLDVDPGTNEWLTDQLAAHIFALSKDVRDIGKFEKAPVQEYVKDEHTYNLVVVEPGTSHFYDKPSNRAFVDMWDQRERLTCHDCGSVEQAAMNAHLLPDVSDNIFFSVSNSRHYWLIALIFTAQGLPFFVAARYRQQTVSDALKELASLVFSAASFVVPGFGQAVAAAILPASFIAAFPGIAAFTSSTVVNTALSGGDVERAVASSLTSFVGAQVGSIVAGVTDAQALGRLAAAGVSASLRGGDIKQAVAMAALQMAPSVVNSFVSSPTMPASLPLASTTEASMNFDLPDYGSEIVDPSASFSFTANAFSPSAFDVGGDGFSFASNFDATGMATLDIGSFGEFADVGGLQGFDLGVSGGMSFEPDWSALEGFQVPDFGLTAADTNAYSWSTGSALETQVGPDNSGADWSFGDVLKGVTDAAMAVVRVNAAWQASNRPPVIAPRVTSSPTQRASVPVPSTGSVVTSDPLTGRSVSTRPTPGVPHALPGGGVMINNGDGTYTVSDARGASQTRSYGAASSQSSSVSPWVWGGAAALALFALR
jgi:hypothetical protein